MVDGLEEAIALYNEGKKNEAGNIFAGLVKANPNNERAWVGLSLCVAPEEQKKYCLNQVLRINPQNERAKKMLASLEFKPIFEPSKNTSASIPQTHSQKTKSSVGKKQEIPNVSNNLPWVDGLKNLNRLPRNIQTGLKIIATLVILLLIFLGINWVGNKISYEGIFGHVNGYSWNALGSADRGGVTVEIPRIVVYYKSSLSKEEQKAYNIRTYRNADTICQMYIKITNNSSRIVSIYPGQGLVMVNNEQVQLSLSGYTSGTTSGDILPGATVQGTISFGLKDVTPDTIKNMMITFSAPYDNDYYTSYDDYVFYFDLSQHKWQDKPDSLE